MPSAPGAPGSAAPPRANSFNAPFPRANNTTKFNLPRRLPATAAAAAAASSASSSTNKAPLAAMPTRRIQAPHTNTMGPPPPARSRNVKFDQMFYTSPLPRSISKAYNDLQAAGGTAMVSSALRTGVMTTRAVAPRVAPRVVVGVAARSSPRGKAVVPAAAAETGDVVGTATTAAVAAAATTPASEKESLAVSTTTTIEPTPEPTPEPEPESESESVAAAPDRDLSDEPQSLSGPVVQTGKGANRGNKVVEREAPTAAAAAKSPSPVPAPTPPVTRSFAEAWAEEDNAFMMSLSDDDKEWHPLARSKSTSKANSNTPAVPTHAAEQGVKHTSSAPPRQKKAVKTRARVAPVKKTKPVVRTRKVATKVTRHEKKVEMRKAQSGRPSAQQKPKPTPTPTPTLTPTAAALKRDGSSKSVLPGFQVPPGILAKTGSGWDPGSGRRLSRRVSTGIPPPDVYTRTPSDTRSARDTRSRQRRASAGVLSAPTPIPSPISTPAEENDILAPADTSADMPIDTPAPVEETPTRKAPKNRPEASRSAAEKEQIPDPDISTTTPAARRSTRNSLGHANTEEVPDSDPRRTMTTSGKRPRSSFGELQVLVGTTTTTFSSSSRRSTRNVPAALEKKTPLSKFHQQDTPQSPLQPPLPPPPPLKKTRRSLRGSLDLPSFVVEVKETPQKGFGRSRVIEETPQPPPPPPPPPPNGKQTPPQQQQQQQHRAMRASTTRKRTNPEFEFSDGEQD